MERQSTIAQRVACTGIGLHRGEQVEFVLAPGEPDSGVVFIVPDAVPDVVLDTVPDSVSDGDSDRMLDAAAAGRIGAGFQEIPASAVAVASTHRATTLASGSGAGAARITTVEHLLATLSVLGIDNVRIEVDGREIPVMDGSAAPFVDLVRIAGRVEQDSPRRVLGVARPFELREGERWIRVEASDRLRVSYAVDFAHPSIGRQELEIEDLDDVFFERELAAARTFGFAHEVEDLRRAGLAKGGSLENTVVLGDAGVANPGGLRWPDEFVRHKVVDLLGDLALLGNPLRAHIQVERGGHGLHHGLVRALLDDEGLLTEARADAAAEARGSARSRLATLG